MHFVHESLSQRVRFETGGAADGTRAEVERLGAERVMLIAAPAEAELADVVTAGLPVALRHDEVVMHVPLAVAERARSAAIARRRRRARQRRRRLDDGTGQGGRDDHRAADRRGTHHLCRSEATTVWGLTEADRKTTGVDPGAARVRSSTTPR